jgi:hypothetical protein
MAIPVVSNDIVISLWVEGRDARNHKNTLKAIGGDLFSAPKAVSALLLIIPLGLEDFTR